MAKRGAYKTKEITQSAFANFIAVLLTFFSFKGKWQQKFLSSYLTETPKQYIKVYYRIFISALFGEMFWLEIFSRPPSWIFVDMHDTSQLGSRNFFFLRHND